MAIDNIARGMASKALNRTSVQGETNYAMLINKPKINNIELNNNVTLDDLGVYNKEFINNALQDLEHDKLSLKRYALSTDKILQSDATEIISNYANYEGQYIEFLTNGDAPNKTVGYGYVVTDSQGNQFLITYNINGTITQWNKYNYEKHLFETFSFINENMVDLDNLTIDIEGEAPYMASVRKGINKPPQTSDNGVIVVIAYSIDKQVQIYRDMITNRIFHRTITGEADRHSFSGWMPLENLLFSPSGKQFKIVVDDLGNLTTEEIV